ncbi:hypothetical protein ACFE04_005074 [Oxalis oulophora]
MYMSVALQWVNSPNTESASCFRFLYQIPDANPQTSSFNVREKKQKWRFSSLKSDSRYPCLGSSGLENGTNFPIIRNVVASPAGEIVISSEQKVNNVVLKQASLIRRQLERTGDLDAKPDITLPGSLSVLSEAYDRCGEICAEYAKTFYLGKVITFSSYKVKSGTLLMTPERRRAIWAIYGLYFVQLISMLDLDITAGIPEIKRSGNYLICCLMVVFLHTVWCRRTDELVDGPNASHITPAALDRWEDRLEDLFKGRPFDMLDAALSDTVANYPVDIQPFKDMIEGMRLDLKKSRYMNFDELYLYCYYVAGTVGLMSVPIMGIAPESKAPTESVYDAALALGIANQLTNILRDVGEDARRGRIYLPQDELAQAGLSDDDIFAGKVTDKWRNFMKKQIERARVFFDKAEAGVTELSAASRWPVWASLLLYRQILDEIEANDYNNFTKRAYVSKAKKILALPMAYGKSVIQPTIASSRILKS